MRVWEEWKIRLHQSLSVRGKEYIPIVLTTHSKDITFDHILLEIYLNFPPKDGEHAQGVLRKSTEGNCTI